MPGSSWLSWGRKKPPASSIAGTREPIQPPSINIPPYPPENGPSPSAAGSTAMSGYPSSSPSDMPSAYGPPPAGPTGLDNGAQTNGVQTASANSGYPTGPYGTGGPGPATPQTQQGFYRTGAPDSGPIASTADARGSYPPATAPGYGAGIPSSGYPAPATTPGGAAPYGTDSLPPAGNYAPVTTPATNQGASDYAYPETGTAPVTPLGANSAYSAPAPTPYRSAPYPVGPSTYGDTPAYDAASQYSPYAGSPATGTAYSTGSADGPSTGTSSGYRPGSTSRNSSLLNPTSGTPSPTGTYYSR